MHTLDPVHVQRGLPRADGFETSPCRKYHLRPRPRGFRRRPPRGPRPTILCAPGPDFRLHPKNRLQRVRCWAGRQVGPEGADRLAGRNEIPARHRRLGAIDHRILPRRGP
jgi:hypothetical protein